MHAATLAPMSSPLPAGTVIAVYSMECEISAGPRILRYFEADESDLAYACLSEHNAAGRVVCLAEMAPSPVVERLQGLRDAAIDLAFASRGGLSSPAYVGAMETAWKMLGRTLHPSTWP